MQTIHYSISDKKALSTPDKPVLVAGESGTSEIVLSSVPTAWEGFEVRALLTTPARKLVDAFAVGNGFLLTNTMLDAQGHLYIEFVAYRGGTEIDRSLPDKLYVNAGRKELGDIDPAPLPDIVAEMVAAKGDCDSAAAAAVLATERIDTTDADIKAAEAVRQSAEIFRGTNESGRVAAENVRVGFYAGFNGQFASAETKRKRKQKYPGAVSIVFDDGLSGDYDYAYPLLKKYDVPACFAISANKIGQASYMTIPQLLEMKESGLIDFADHEYNHTNMTTLTEQQVKDNLILSRAWFLTNLGAYPTTFAYPGGYTNNLIRNIIYPLYRRARSTDDAHKNPIMYGQKNTPWEFPWIGFDAAWFASITDYINYVRNAVKAGMHVVPSFHNVGLTTAASVVSATDLETFLQFICDENINVAPIDGIFPPHNYVKDPSFENMPVGALPVDANPINNGNVGAMWDKNGTNPNITIDNTVARSGTKSLKLSRTYGDGLVQNSARAYVPAHSADLMRLSFWFKGSHSTGCKVSYDVTAYDECGVVLGSVGAYVIPTVTTDWLLWAYDMTAKPGAAYYGIILSLPVPASGEVGERTVWIDDVSINSVNNKKYNETRT